MRRARQQAYFALACFLARWRFVETLDEWLHGHGVHGGPICLAAEISYGTPLDYLRREMGL